MKKYLIAFMVLVSLATASSAWADKPVFTKPQFTTTIKCDKQVSSDNDTGLAKIECAPADLKKYPFLADLTKDPTAKGSIYQFDIARIEDKALAKPILLVKMHNETIYTIWGSTGAYAINADGTYTPQWNVTGGEVVYTASCSKQLSFIIKGNEKSTYGEWVYDGKNITQIAGYDKLDDFTCP